jgi:hypothetical protein
VVVAAQLAALVGGLLYPAERLCRVLAAVRAASLSSSGEVMERTKSCGAKRSVTVMKWTATRAAVVSRGFYV